MLAALRTYVDEGAGWDAVVLARNEQMAAPVADLPVSVEGVSEHYYNLSDSVIRHAVEWYPDYSDCCVLDYVATVTHQKFPTSVLNNAAAYLQADQFRTNLYAKLSIMLKDCEQEEFRCSKLRGEVRPGVRDLGVRPRRG